MRGSRRRFEHFRVASVVSKITSNAGVTANPTREASGAPFGEFVATTQYLSADMKSCNFFFLASASSCMDVPPWLPNQTQKDLRKPLNKSPMRFEGRGEKEIIEQK